MAFSSTTVRLLKAAPGIDRSPLYDDLASALAANVSSLTALGGTQAVARAAAALIDIYRGDPTTAGALSAGAGVSVAASSTTSLLTLQIQIIPAA